MEKNKKIKWWVYIVALLILIIMAYYGYERDQRWRRSDRAYTIGTLKAISRARNGWKISREYSFSGKMYQNSAIYSFEYFTKQDVGRRYFIKLLPECPGKEAGLIPIISVPDSIDSAPPEGWTEAWMKEHFPEVVEYVHDTR